MVLRRRIAPFETALVSLRLSLPSWKSLSPLWQKKRWEPPIAQGEISMSVAFSTHVWKMANICKHMIVWLFSHMCAFSHTYVSKSKHVWKIAPRCKYTNVFGFFQTCWIKVKHLPKLTCVVFYTQVWLFSNIFAKSQTCVEKTIMFH